MQQLEHALSRQSLFEAGLLVAKEFDSSLCVTDEQFRMQQLVNGYARLYRVTKSEEENLQILLDFFYRDLLFSGRDASQINANHMLVSEVMTYRTGIPVSLTMILVQFLRQVGFRADGVNFPGHYLLRVQVRKDRFWYINPNNGKLLDWQALEALYFSLLGKLDDEEMPKEALQPASDKETVSKLINTLKSYYMQQEELQHSLNCVDLLLRLHPDDPYARRDRGVLLQQLQCPQLALADYQFFLRQCPQDPDNPLLKRHIQSLLHQSIVLH